METQNHDSEMRKTKFRLYDHPWLALLAVIATIVFSIALSGTAIFGLIRLPEDSPSAQFAQGISYHVLTGFIFAPFVLHLPKGRRNFRQYLDDIGFSKMQPLTQLVLLALSCYVILAMSQAAASLVFRLLEGMPINWSFVRQVFDLSGDLPPESPVR